MNSLFYWVFLDFMILLAYCGTPVYSSSLHTQLPQGLCKSWYHLISWHDCHMTTSYIYLHFALDMFPLYFGHSAALIWYHVVDSCIIINSAIACTANQLWQHFFPTSCAAVMYCGIIVPHSITAGCGHKNNTPHLTTPSCDVGCV